MVHVTYAKNAIAPCEWQGRFGDQIMLYMATKYLAEYYGMDCFYREFKYSDKLMLSSREKKFNASIKNHYNHTLHIQNPQDLELIKQHTDTLFILQWGPIVKNIFATIFEKKYYNRQLLADMRDMLQLIEPLEQPILDIPTGYISVAVHIRKGEGFDKPLKSTQIYRKQKAISPKASDELWPTKFPPEQYYIDQINTLAWLLTDKKIIFYVFSDAKDTANLTERIKTHCARKDLEFVTVTHTWQNSLFHDLYAMAECDCLICSTSNLSYTAEIIGNHNAVIRPYTWQWQDNILYITQAIISLFCNKNSPNVELIFDDQNRSYISEKLHECF